MKLKHYIVIGLAFIGIAIASAWLTLKSFGRWLLDRIFGS